MNDSILDEDSDAMISLSHLLMVLNPIIKNINGCLIIDNNDEIKVEKVNFDRIIRIHGDKTGYEASSNEIRVNDLVDGKSVDFKAVLALGFNILKVWSINLKRKYPDSRFCLIITCENDSVIIRFHQVRDNENEWLIEDLEQYTDAVAYQII
jgi:hypothetical protein